MRNSSLKTHRDHKSTFSSMHMHENLQLFIKSRPKKPVVLSEIDFFFSFRQTVDDPPPLFLGCWIEQSSL